MTGERPKGVIRLGDKDFPTWPFVLDKAHAMGLIGIETELVETPNEANGHSYIVKARALFRPLQDGDPIRVFTGFGDAGPRNVSPKIKEATLRMAETRAMGRALRTGTNIGEAMYEELGEESDAHAGRAAPAEKPIARTSPTAGSDSRAAKGFEPTFSLPGTRQYTRAELIQRAGETVEQAMALGMKLKALDLEHATNEALVQLTEKIQERIQGAVAAQQAEAEEAA